MKKCTKCKEEKTIENFVTRTGNITSRCKKCLAEQQKEWLSQNKDRVNAERRERKKNDPAYAERIKIEKAREYEKNKKKYAEYFKKYRKTNLEKIRRIRNNWKKNNKRKICVHAMVKYRLDKGIIVKPETCQLCGKSGDIEAHHKDYDKPFDIQWLCIPCHGKTRKKRGSL